MNYTQYAIPANLVLICQTDWKETLFSADYKEELQKFKDHTKQYPGTVYEELHVHTIDSNVYYAGQDGLAKFLGKRCAFHALIDDTSIFSEDAELDVMAEKVYFHPQVGIFFLYKDQYYSPDQFWKTFGTPE